ncbi:unnamed protein product [Dicrocoelium dendriticum]|nr:unnamed protein product [Dicrocoelium dendriticum]
MLKLEEVIFLMGTLKRKLGESRSIKAYNTVSQVTAVLLSPLFNQCYGVMKAFSTTLCTVELNAILTKTSVQPAISSLPPLTADALRRRVEQFCIAEDREIFLIELPPPHPDQLSKRCGLILRQHLVDGEVKRLYIAGLEEGSPASRAHNIRSGDEILVISGFPLDRLTMEQLRYGLLDSPEAADIPFNANLYELAENLLNAPYRSKSKGGIPLRMPTIIVARRSPSTNVIDTRPKTQFEAIDSFYHETLLPAGTDTDKLGIQFGYNEDAGSVYIKSIAPESQAACDGILKEGDCVLEINYQKVDHLPAHDALSQIERACRRASFVNIKAFRPPLTKESGPRSSEIRRSQFVTHKALSYDSASSSDATGAMEFDCSDSTMTAVAAPWSQRRVDMNGFASGDHQLYSGDLVQSIQFWRSRLPLSAEVVGTEYDMGDVVHCLGITIEGTVEKPSPSSQYESHHYIVEVLPESCDGIRNILLPGDELLQINKNILLHEPHLEVARLLHEAPSVGYLICARPKHPISIEPIIEEEKTMPETEDIQEESSSDNTLGSDQISSDKGFKTSTSASEQTSDVDKFPQAPRILYSSRSKPTDTKLRYSPTDETEVFVTNQTTSDEEFSQTQMPWLDAHPGSPEPFPRNEAFQENVMQMMDLSNAAFTPRLEPTATMESGSSILYRLPMPPKITSVSLQGGEHERRSLHHSTALSMPDPQANNAVSFSQTEQTWLLAVFKNTGEWLGLELEATDGGPKGIRLCHITPGSPLENTLFSLRHRCHTTSSMAAALEEPRLPQIGDWILSVAGHSLCNVSGLSARITLRHLVMQCGYITIKYAPGNSHAH